MANAAQRTAMLELAIAGNARFAIERVELDLPVPSYTVPTLRALAAREPGNRFALLLGADAVRDLASWFEIEALPGLADVVAFARAGAEPLRHRLVSRTLDVPAIDVRLVCRPTLKRTKAIARFLDALVDEARRAA